MPKYLDYNEVTKYLEFNVLTNYIFACYIHIWIPFCCCFHSLAMVVFLVETSHVDAKHAVSRSIFGGFLGQWSFGFVTNDDFRDRNCFASQIAMNLKSKIKLRNEFLQLTLLVFWLTENGHIFS